MTPEILKRMLGFTNAISKECDACPRKKSQLCESCWGMIAKSIVRDMAPPIVVEPDSGDVKVLIIGELSKTKDFISINRLATRLKASYGCTKKASIEIVKQGKGEMRGAWIRGKCKSSSRV